MWNGGQEVGLKIGNASAGAWHHAAMRYDADAQVLDGFVDGVEASGNVSGPKVWPSSSLAYALGRGDATHMMTGNSFAGDVDDFRVFNRALTASQIDQILRG